VLSGGRLRRRAAIEVADDSLQPRPGGADRSLPLGADPWREDLAVSDLRPRLGSSPRILRCSVLPLTHVTMECPVSTTKAAAFAATAAFAFQVLTRSMLCVMLPNSTVMKPAAWIVLSTGASVASQDQVFMFSGKLTGYSPTAALCGLMLLADLRPTAAPMVTMIELNKPWPAPFCCGLSLMRTTVCDASRHRIITASSPGPQVAGRCKVLISRAFPKSAVPGSDLRRCGGASSATAVRTAAPIPCNVDFQSILSVRPKSALPGSGQLVGFYRVAEPCTRHPPSFGRETRLKAPAGSWWPGSRESGRATATGCD
jgi:hypothetical protein